MPIPITTATMTPQTVRSSVGWPWPLNPGLFRKTATAIPAMIPAGNAADPGNAANESSAAIAPAIPAATA